MEYFFQQLINGGAANGNIQCRAVLEGNPVAAGCVPLNLFGLANIDPAAMAFPDLVVVCAHSSGARAVGKRVSVMGPFRKSD